MEKGFFHPDRGYWQAITQPDESALALYPQGTVEVQLPPSPMHKMVDGEWVAPTQEELHAVAASNVRSERDLKLATEVDPIAGNALRWSALTAEQQQAWADYRQALLDVPEQSGFPHNVTWPSKPE